MGNQGYYEGNLHEDPRGQYPPVPPKVIGILIKRGQITFPLDEIQKAKLEMLQYIWSDKLFLRFQLAEMKKKDREHLVELPRYGKVDIYVLRMLGLGKKDPEKVSTRVVIASVKKHLGVSISEEKVKQLRQVLYDHKRGKSLKAIAF